MSKSYFESVTTNAAYSRLASGASPLSELINSGDLYQSASNWDAKHLIACHIQVSGKRKRTLLQHKFPEAGTKFRAGDDETEIKAFIEGLKEDQRDLREHALIHEPNVGASLARVWVALREVKDLDLNTDDSNTEPDGPNRSSGRNRTQVQRADFQNSSNIHFGSSQDPPSDPPAEPPSSDPSAFAPEQSSANHLPVEDYTVILGFVVIKHILLYTQAADLTTPVETRQRERATINIGGIPVTAIDDGGLVLFSVTGQKSKRSVVLFEAKRRREVRASTHTLEIKDELLAQMTCEALAARSAGEEELTGDHVFIVHMVQQYMCFFDFDIPKDQLDDVKEGVTPKEAIKVTPTKWLDLEDKSDRKAVVQNICQLAAYLGEE